MGWLDGSGAHQGVYCWLWCYLGPGVVEISIRDLPAVYQDQWRIDQRHGNLEGRADKTDKAGVEKHIGVKLSLHIVRSQGVRRNDQLRGCRRHPMESLVLRIFPSLSNAPSIIDDPGSFPLPASQANNRHRQTSIMIRHPVSAALHLTPKKTKQQANHHFSIQQDQRFLHHTLPVQRFQPDLTQSNYDQRLLKRPHMPVIRSIPENKRRVRTGCLSCRKRRRKCDERKPSCTSCEARGVTCAYPDLQFIPKSTAGDVGSGKPRNSSYTSIKFVNEPLSPVSKSSDTNSNKNSGGGENLRRHSDPRQLGIRNSCTSSITVDSLLTTTPLTEDRKKEHPLVDWDGYFDTENVSAGRKHCALVRHFRYMMVPWVEAGDLISRFGVDIMYLAQEHPPIQSVIIELAANQMDLIYQRKDTAANRQKDKSQMHALEGPAKRIADSLSRIAEYLRSGPSQWRHQAAYEMGLLSPNSTTASIEEPLRSLCSLHSRFDLASSIILRQPPLTPRSFYCPPGFPPAWDPECPSATYMWSLHHLTITLHLLHDPTRPSTQTLLQDSPHQTLPSFPAHPSSPATWLATWKSCQTWRDRRPVSIRPILDIGIIEAGQIDTQAPASFPIQLYTNALAVQCNVAYHLCSLLLLANKPRLLKLSDHQLSATSQSWHVQTIAGIACTNDFAEQWDPLLIAALLFIARDMTHPSQQNAMRACFRKIRAATGIRFDRELGELESLWNVGRSG